MSFPPKYNIDRKKKYRNECHREFCLPRIVQKSSQSLSTSGLRLLRVIVLCKIKTPCSEYGLPIKHLNLKKEFYSLKHFL